MRAQTGSSLTLGRKGGRSVSLMLAYKLKLRTSRPSPFVHPLDATSTNLLPVDQYLFFSLTLLGGKRTKEVEFTSNRDYLISFTSTRVTYHLASKTPNFVLLFDTIVFYGIGQLCFEPTSTQFKDSKLQ